MTKGVSQLNQAVVSDLVKRHRGSGLASIGRSSASLPRGTYVGVVAEAHPQTDLWSRPVTRAVLEVREGTYAGRQISADVRGTTAKILIQASETGRHVRFDVFVRHHDNGRRFSQVNRETIRWTDDRAGDATNSFVAESIPGLPAPVRAMLSAGSVSQTGEAGHAATVSSHAATAVCGTPSMPAVHDISSAAMAYQHGFTCIGAKNAARRIISWMKHYESMAACTDASVHGRPVFLSLHAFTDDLITYVRNHEKPGSMAGYQGSTYSPLLVIDIDRKDEAGNAKPADSLQDACRLLVVLLELGIPDDCITVSFSGSKGFHLDFPSMLAGAMPARNFPEIQKSFCSMIAAEAGVEIDTSLYNTLHSLRAPNSRHEESGLFKVSMTTEEFLRLSLEEIKSLAATPRPFAPPDFVREPIPALWELWRHAEQAARTKVRHGERDAGGTAVDARIWQSTWQFLIGGAPDGERAMATFKAAANLAHFESVADLTRALLSRGVSLCGLPPTEAAGHIESALHRAAEARVLAQIQFPPQP